MLEAVTKQSQIVETKQMIGMSVGVDHRFDQVDFLSQQLQSQFGRRIDQKCPARRSERQLRFVSVCCEDRPIRKRRSGNQSPAHHDWYPSRAISALDQTERACALHLECDRRSSLEPQWYQTRRPPVTIARSMTPYDETNAGSGSASLTRQGFYNSPGRDRSPPRVAAVKKPVPVV